MSGSPRMLVAFTLATTVVVAAVVALATGSWWALAAAVLLLFAATGFVMAFIARRMDEGYKPDPVTETRTENPLSAP